ncbi:DUF6349 family protein [Leucobacter sp. NPDC058333]|uniref:DUF6349 family protein n=1 Tax=Leucobacter sp. NPDC058333 TaxID=3346450 RepID=UPI0036657A90
MLDLTGSKEGPEPMNTAQLAFDIDALLHDALLAATPAWDGAPLRYHEEHRTSAELDAAFDRYRFEYGNHGCIPDSHMWSRYMFGPQHGLAIDNHEFVLYAAETSCREAEHDHHGENLPGDTQFQALCEPCNWRYQSNDESFVIETWHDHAVPGWRTLPVVPQRLQGIPPRHRNPLREWVEEHYPLEAQAPGHPIVTARNPVGTRHVPGRSPWGGYDLSDSAL